MKVLFLDTVHEILSKRLQEKGFECIHMENSDLENIRSALPEIHGIVIRSRFPMDEKLLGIARNLKFIARSGAGMENIDVPYCESREITLFNAPEGNRNAVGEHALGMLLALLNKLHTGDREVRTGLWRREENRGIELDGKTVGIIGFGNNGSAFARKLRGFDVKVLAYDKYKSGFQDNFVTEATLSELYENADVVSFHIPQNEETIFFADDEFFHQFKKPIWLLNLARGKVVRTSSLVNALKSNKVLGAGLDVLEYEKTSFESFFEQEIPADLNYILQSDRVILSPHVGGWTVESYFKLSDVLADKILEKYAN